MNADAADSAPTPFLRAAGLMLASTVSFGLMAVVIRYVSKDLPTTEIAFFRNLFGLLALVLRRRPKSSGARAAWNVVRVLLLAADLALICWWAYLFGTGAWAS